MFEEKNIQNQPPQNLPTQGDRETEEKKLFGETEETFSGPIKPPPAIPKEFLIRKKKSPILLIVVTIVIIAAIVVLAQSSVFKISPQKPVTPTTPSTTPTVPSSSAPTSPPTNQILDTDGDGLTDEQELNLGTNLQSTDSDNDGLFDFEEVKVYKTDPLNPDTDGDGYQDGEEVRAGYNPKDATPGAKLLDLMKAIEQEKTP